MSIKITSSNNDKLLDLVKDKLKLSETEVEIGYFEEDTYEANDKVKNASKKVHVAQVAYWQENGFIVPTTNKIMTSKGKLLIIPPHEVPPRPFMSNAVKKYGNKAINEVVRSIANGMSEKQAMLRGAELLKDGIKQEITDIDTPPNSEATIEIKGSSNPLINTGRLRRSVKVKERE